VDRNGLDAMQTNENEPFGSPICIGPLKMPEGRLPTPAVKLGYFLYSTKSTRASDELVCAIYREVFMQGEMCSEVWCADTLPPGLHQRVVEEQNHLPPMQS
jgi:hypothetical protein